MTGSDEDVYQRNFLSKEDNMIVEMLSLEQLELGAYVVNIDNSDSNSNVAPVTFKARKILNAELLDIYAHKKREVYYSEYLAVEELISLMRNRTDYLEEKLFIRVHQINELAMQQSIITLQALIKIFQSKQVLENLETIEEYINQILRFFIVQKETNFVLCNMSTKNFVHGFRSSLGTASGVQSCQYYIMQMLLGLNKERHILNDPVKLLHLKEYDIQKIKTYQNHDSLFKVIQDWLLDLYNENEDVRKIGELPHIDEVLKGCKDFSKEVGVTVLYLLNNPDCLQSKIVEYVLKFESSFIAFLDSHIVLVDHHLGNKRGTSNTSGGNYLRQSKLSQIIWRDLYHLQNHANSINDWKIQQKPQNSTDRVQDPGQKIIEELSQSDYNDQHLDLSWSDSLRRAEQITKDKIKGQFIKNFDDANERQGLVDKCQNNSFDETKRQLASRYEKNDAIIDHSKIILTNGHSNSVQTAFSEFLNKGDNIVVLTPCSSYIHKAANENQIELRYLSVLNKDKLDLQPERLRQLVDKNTKSIWIPNFSEIIGQDLNQEELQTIKEVCDYHKLFIVYDEGSYFSSQHTTLHMLYQSRYIPTLIISGIPTPQMMKEFDISWIMPINNHNFFDKIFEKFDKIVQAQKVSNTTKDCLASILDDLNEMRRERFNESNILRSQMITERISKINGLSVQQPIQPLRLLIHIDIEMFKNLEDDIQFSKELLQKYQVKILPSQTMLQPNKLLLIIDQDENKIMEALDKLEAFCIEKQQ